MPWFPLATGNLARPGGPLDELARAHKVSPEQVALAWLLEHSPVTLPIPGTSSVAHFDENLSALDIELSDASMEALDEV
jgi:aryl-alcohol dehydrogenase-like predicted oxidoreductase